MTGALLVTSPAIYAEAGVVDGYLLCEAGVIRAIGQGPPPAVPSGATVIDAPDARVLPGMIDIHIHGAGGWPVEGGDAGALLALARYLAAFGVTGFLPTASARRLEEVEATLATIRTAMAAQETPTDTSDKSPSTNGARILGAHLEGPFLNPTQKGAMNPDLFLLPEPAHLDRLLAAGGGAIRRVTLAPERPGGVEAARRLAGLGIAVAGGHTDATYEETLAGIEAGVRIANHTYNAMRGLHHREPGALGAYLLDDRVTCEVICDFLHVHPAAIALLLKAAGPDRVAVISDAIPAAGMPAGHYHLFGRDLYIDEQGFSRLESGTIAGSTKLMRDGLRNLVEGLNLPLEEAWRLTSLNPARAIGLADRKGSLAEGKDADLILIDHDWKVRWTVVEGRIAHRPEEPPPAVNPAFLAARM